MRRVARRTRVGAANAVHIGHVARELHAGGRLSFSCSGIRAVRTLRIVPSGRPRQSCAAVCGTKGAAVPGAVWQSGGGD